MKNIKSNREGKIKIYLVFLILITGIAIGYGLTKLLEKDDLKITEGEEEDLYTCGMHPNVIQKGPGICPICNMKLVPLRTTKKGTTEEKEEKQEDLIVIDPVVVQNIGVRTEKSRRGPLKKVIHSTGNIIEDETRVGVVNLKIAGWIEKVYVNQTGQNVRKGDPLIEIYSPSVYTAQQEYLVALDNLEKVKNSPSEEVKKSALMTLESVKQRLRFWDITDTQIRELEKTKTVKKTITLLSPFNGVVTHKGALPGQKVEPGTDLYHISDLSNIWVEASIFDSDLPFVKVGDEALMKLSNFPGKEFKGKVSFISPVLNEMTRDLKIRIEFLNPKLELKPGMYGEIYLTHIVDSNAVLIPDDAIIHSGEKDIVFISKGEGKFLPVRIIAGYQSKDNYVQVLSGLNGGEDVVVSAQFLLDSESSLQEAVRKMTSVHAGHSGIEMGKEEKKVGIDTLAKLKKKEVTKAEVTEEHLHKIEKVKEKHIEHKEKEEHIHHVEKEEEKTYQQEIAYVKDINIPIANAISIEPDGTVMILCPVMKNVSKVSDKSAYTDYKGKRYYYCCPGCKKLFEKDPESYLAQLDTILKKQEYKQ